tara:strand:+ start:8524 stop:10455 length:1932 start_codon:yes stop_codon:yes gene_type:complete
MDKYSWFKPKTSMKVKYKDYKIDPSNIAKSINEGPQKRVLTKLKHINASYVTPRQHYAYRGLSDRCDKLEITDKFSWKRGYRDKIINIINNKFNQYDKSAASLKTLLKGRPERTAYMKDDFVNQVIDVDTMMKKLRQQNKTFSDNTVLFEAMWTNYFHYLEESFKTVDPELDNQMQTIGPNMKLSWHIVAPISNDIEDDLYLNNSWIQYTLHWEDSILPVMTQEGDHLQDIPLGDIIMQWNVRLFPLMLELIRQYYRRLERFSNQYTSEELLHPDNFNVILQNIKSHHIERWSEDSNPFYYMHSNRSNSRRENQLNYHRKELQQKGLVSAGVMINGRLTDFKQYTPWDMESPDEVNVLSHPYIGNVEGRGNVDSFYGQNATFDHFIQTELMGRYKVPSNNNAGSFVLSLQNICWGDLHGDMWSSLIRLNFIPFIFHIKNWNRYSIPGSNPLNNIRMSHYGMPAAFNPEYKRRISPDARLCWNNKMRSHYLKEEFITNDNINEDTHLSTHNAMYPDRIIEADVKYAKLIQMVDDCDNIKCELRNNCDSYSGYAGLLNALLTTEEETYPFGTDLFGLTEQAIEEESTSETEDIALPPLPFDDDYPLDDDPTGLPIDEVVVDNDNQEAVAQQVATWAAAARRRNNG